ncbi:MAG: hypothetical protein HY897_18565 [Deltaproteobacteria bacterium]|nr:hypothetical protein [Deltaproteobacteria bacterium]
MRSIMTGGLTLFLIGFAMYAASCDDGGSLDCAKLCEKSKECDDSPEDFDTAACQDGCEKSRDLVQEGFQDELMSCIEEECANQEACVNEAAKECEAPDNFDGFIDTLCEKTVECSPSFSMEQCKVMMDQALAQSGAEVVNCLTESAVDSLSDCLGSAACDTFEEDYEKCISDAFGVDLSGAGYSADGGSGDAGM